MSTNEFFGSFLVFQDLFVEIISEVVGNMKNLPSASISYSISRLMCTILLRQTSRGFSLGKIPFSQLEKERECIKKGIVIGFQIYKNEIEESLIREIINCFINARDPKTVREIISRVTKLF